MVKGKYCCTNKYYCSSLWLLVFLVLLLLLFFTFTLDAHNAPTPISCQFCSLCFCSYCSSLLFLVLLFLSLFTLVLSAFVPIALHFHSCYSCSLFFAFARGSPDSTIPPPSFLILLPSPPFLLVLPLQPLFLFFHYSTFS